MIRRPTRSTRTDTLFPYTTLFRSLVLVIEAGMIGSARTACVRENEDALGAVHEGVGISHARRRRAGLQLLTAIGKAHETFCPSGHLGYGVGRSEERRVGKECVRTLRCRVLPVH